MDSWFTLQGIPERAGELENPVHLDYILNFLSNQGRWRYNHWQPTGADVDAEAQKKSASAFLDHLQSTMDHNISISCRICKLEETRILPGETPQWAGWSPMNPGRLLQLPNGWWEGTEHAVPWLVHALDNRELVKKLLALPIKETTAKMLEVCRTHNAINSEVEALGLGSSKSHPCHPQGTPAERSMQATQTSTTAAETTTLLWELHKTACPGMSFLPCKGLPMPSMWQNGTLEGQV